MSDVLLRKSLPGAGRRTTVRVGPRGEMRKTLYPFFRFETVTPTPPTHIRDCSKLEVL